MRIDCWKETSLLKTIMRAGHEQLLSLAIKLYVLGEFSLIFSQILAFPEKCEYQLKLASYELLSNFLGRW